MLKHSFRHARSPLSSRPPCHATPNFASSSHSISADSTATTSSKLALLAELKAKSQQAILKQHSTTTPNNTRLIDERVYHSALEMRMKTNEKLSEVSKYANFLERRLRESEGDLAVAYDVLAKIEGEFMATERMTESLLAVCKFSPNKEELPQMLARLSDRLASLEEATRQAKEVFRARVPQVVPLTWNGVAQSVTFVGEFDEWTKGVELNASDLDSSVRSFEGHVHLLPGRYKCKFMVDGEWRIAPEGWEMAEDEDGNLNNILTVE